MFYLKVSIVRGLAFCLLPFAQSEYDKQYLEGTYKMPFNSWQRR